MAVPSGHLKNEAGNNRFSRHTQEGAALNLIPHNSGSSQKQIVCLYVTDSRYRTLPYMLIHYGKPRVRWG